MTKGRKILGEERRTFILKALKEADKPITGGELASYTNVSRQVIVGDVTLLKARNEPIIATSQGYMFLPRVQKVKTFERIVASNHHPSETEKELLLLVDLGITVKDVKIEHPVYGDLTASIMVSNRKEVQQFIEKIQSTQATYLSELTDGYHLHTISALEEKTLDEAVVALRDAGFLAED